MVNLLTISQAVAAASISIIDHTQGYAVDLANTGCKDFQPVTQFEFHRTAAEQLKLKTVAANEFQIINIKCNTTVTYPGSGSGAEPERSQTVAVAGSHTAWNITSTNASSTTGPFHLLESVSGLALTAWPIDPAGDATHGPLTLERVGANDTRQLFYLTPSL
ncbi:hypothetical protein D9758_007001 [Tetrapyrgos nigripes]|uniref:Ricin B lectin domain-containing protein n=1 Tax=Tetrapyrgos nigripes TaxID=182062 RepID=A0A8H5LV07_9AGAR|nr:hypothetical protein D9758_007001 [Tetrapyrgos nigripes]